VDLGLIKEIVISEDGKVDVNMVLTSKVCPMVSHLTEQVRRRIEGLKGIRAVEVMVLDEPWNWDQFECSRLILNEINHLVIAYPIIAPAITSLG